MSEWKEKTLSEVADIIMGLSPKGKTCNNNQIGLPLLNGPTEYGIKYPKPVQYTVDPRRRAKKGDILFCVRGSTTGRMNWADQEYAIGRGIAAIRHKQDENANTFIRGLLDYYLPSLLSGAEGSVFPNINGSQLSEMPVLLPPLPEQRAIAGVLSSLDDKIDLLHRQNKTLEGMAEALWRKMFVEEADPEWKKGKLGDLVELSYGKGLTEKDRVPGKYPVLGSSGVVGHHDKFLVKGPGIVIGRKGTLGVVSYIEEDFFPIDTTFYVRSKTNSGRLYFEYFLLREFAFEDMNSDSAVPGLNRGIAESVECLVPDAESIDKFSYACEPLFAKKTVNQLQMDTLSRLRDTLLPRLMSGEVRVKI